MSIEVKPVGDRCNLNCSYCYEDGIRSSKFPVDVDAMKEALIAAGGSFTVFGGEPLLTPRDILEELFCLGLERYHTNSIQTNALMIDSVDMVNFLKRFKVNVGISFDGPGELNLARCPLPITSKIENNINLLIGNGLIPSFIVTLTRYNTGDKLPQLIDWFKWLDTQGVTSIRLHNAEDNGKGAEYLIDHDTQYNSFIAIYESTQELRIQFDVFTDIKKALSGDLSGLTCIWNSCDPYNTPAVVGVKANGESENCGRVYKDGTVWIKSDSSDNVREVTLKNTPTEDGGCKGCKYFPICKGQCPGTAIDGDWRNRTRDCEFWKRLFSYFAPPDFEERIQKLESQTKVGGHGDVPHGDWHGDHTDKHRLLVPVKQ